MGNTVSSEDMYIYWCRNTTWKSGAPATDTHQAFNPMVESQGISVPQRVYDLITTNNGLYPSIHLDKRLEPSTITFRCYYRDPFMLATFFTYKGLPTSWTESNDVMTFNFNGGDEDKNIAVQLHLEDKSGSGNHVNLLLDGGRTVGYRWIIEEGNALIEEIDIKFAEISESTTAIDITDGFDDESMDGTGLDGGWSLWDTQLCSTAEKVVHASSCTITVGGVAVPGLHVQRAVLDLKRDQEMKHVQSSQTASIVYDKPRSPYTARISGILKGHNDISEAIAALASKTQATIKFQYATNKYMQFTIGVLKNIEGLKIPQAGESIDVSYIYEGGAASVLTFSWTGTVATDPSSMIEHTDV